MIKSLRDFRESGNPCGDADDKLDSRFRGNDENE